MIGAILNILSLKVYLHNWFHAYFIMFGYGGKLKLDNLTILVFWGWKNGSFTLSFFFFIKVGIFMKCFFLFYLLLANKNNIIIEIHLTS